MQLLTYTYSDSAPAGVSGGVLYIELAEIDLVMVLMPNKSVSSVKVETWRSIIAVFLQFCPRDLMN